jgi:hypothetical protein
LLLAGRKLRDGDGKPLVKTPVALELPDFFVVTIHLNIRSTNIRGSNEMIARKNILWLFMAMVQATPLPPMSDASISTNRDERRHTSIGVPATNRTIFTVISLFCMGILSFLLGTWRDMN